MGILNSLAFHQAETGLGWHCGEPWILETNNLNEPHESEPTPFTELCRPHILLLFSILSYDAWLASD